MIPRTPTDVPGLRRELHAYATDGRLFQMYYGWCAAGLQPARLRPGISAAADARILAEAEADRLANADLFFIDEDLSDLLDAAYPSMPTFAPRPYDVPSPYGFVVFARPLVTFRKEIHLPDTGDPDVDEAQARIISDGVRIVAASWGPHSRAVWPAGGVWFTFWSDARSNPDGNPALEAASRLLPPLIVDNECALGWVPDGTTDERYHLPASDDSTGGWARMLMCAWRLAGQTNLAESSVERTPRPERRRTERANLPVRDVRVVRLRRRLREARDAAGTGREYRHRWVVRGHWRQQWYPAQQVHRPIWIAPHLKGPDDAPLLGGERVTVL